MNIKDEDPRYYLRNESDIYIYKYNYITKLTFRMKMHIQHMFMYMSFRECAKQASRRQEAALLAC